MQKRLILLTLICLLSALSACASLEPPTATPAPTLAQAPTRAAAPATATQSAALSLSANLDLVWKAVKLPQGDTVARVNSVAIPAAQYNKELQRQLKYLTSEYQLDWRDAQTLAYLPQIQNDILQQLIGTELIRQIAVAEGVSVTKDQVENEVLSLKGTTMAQGAYKTWEEFLQANGLTPEELTRLVAESLLIDAMTAAHTSPIEEEQVHALHILVADEETGKQVLAKLAAGESFADLAKAYSIDDGSKDSGGDLGWFSRGMMVTEFEEVAFSGEIGKDSPLVKTQFGYHIIRVQERKARPLEGEALAERQQAAFSEWYRAQRNKANIEQLLALDMPKQ